MGAGVVNFIWSLSFLEKMVVIDGLNGQATTSSHEDGDTRRKEIDVLAALRKYEVYFFKISGVLFQSMWFLENTGCTSNRGFYFLEYKRALSGKYEVFFHKNMRFT